MKVIRNKIRHIKLSIFLISILLFNYQIRTDVSDSIYPRGIRILYLDSSDNSVAIVWHNSFLSLDAKIEYSLNKDLKNSIVLRPDSIVNVDDTYIYTAYLKNLELGKSYYYQISSDIFHKREIMKFRTLPKNQEELKFLVLTDTQAIGKDREIRNKLINSIREEDFDFFIHLGDIVEKSKLQNEWNEFFEDFECVNSKRIGLYIDGNHDINDKEKLYYHNVPIHSRDSDSYRLDYGKLAYFLGLSYKNPIEQELLEDELETYNSTLWKFSFFHKPIFNSNLRENDLNLDWHLSFIKYDMDLIFTGHNHFYERMYVNNISYLSCPPISGLMKSPSEFVFTNRTTYYEFIRGYMTIKINKETSSINVMSYNEKTEDIFNLENFTISK